MWISIWFPLKTIAGGDDVVQVKIGIRKQYAPDGYTGLSGTTLMSGAREVQLSRERTRFARVVEHLIAQHFAGR